MRIARLTAALCSLAACAHVPDAKEREAAEIHYDLGVNAIQASRTQEALREFLEAVRLNPDLAQAHDALGTVYHWSYGKQLEAKAEFQKAVELKPSFSEAWNNLGVLLAEMGDVPGARVAFDQALANPLYRTPFIAQANLGWAVHLSGQSREGEALVRASLTARPEYCMGHKQLAQILEAGGRAADADASWRDFARFCPDDPEALWHLSSVLVKENKLSDASRALTRCLERAGAKPIAIECRGLLAKLPPLEVEAPAAAPESRPTDAGKSVGGSRDLDPSR